LRLFYAKTERCALSFRPKLRGFMPAKTRLTREEACEALDIGPEAFDRIVRDGALTPEEGERYDVIALAAAAIRHARRRAEITDGTLTAVGQALGDVKPALERLATLPDHAALKGDEHRRAMTEVAAFFTAFAEVMNRATSALKAGEET
jgi:hypothetical protein